MTKKPHRLIPQVLAAGLTLFGAAGCSPVYFSQGLARANQGDFKGAVADNNQKIEFNPNYAITYRWSEMEYELRGGQLRKKEDWSIDYYRSLATSTLGFLIVFSSLFGLIAGLAVYYNQHDTDAETYLNQGNANYNQGKIEEAISDYNRAIELKPNYSDAYLYRGAANDALGKIEEALADYNKAIDLNPNRHLQNSNILW